MRYKSLFVAALACTAFATTASAHPGHGGSDDFASGLLHPLTGIDHILAMLAVGLWGAQMSRRTARILPLAFLALMMVGGALALFHATMYPSLVESMIAASVVVLGLLVASSTKAPAAFAAALVGAFALFHGYAHIVEKSAGASVASYALGFLCASALLLAIGTALGHLLRTTRYFRLERLAGAGIAIYGLLLLFQIA